jgi:hypothetical protein
MACAASLRGQPVDGMKRERLWNDAMDCRVPVFLLLAMIGMADAPASAASPRAQRLLTAAEAGRDLDALPPEELDEDLTAELADVFKQFDPNTAYPIDALYAAIIEALSDDDDDGAEDAISEADLDAEMAEAGTDLPDVVMGALHQADMATASSPGLTKVSADGWQMVRAGAVRSQFAVSFTKRALENTIRAVR